MIPEFEFNQEESLIEEQQKLPELFDYQHGLDGGFGGFIVNNRPSFSPYLSIPSIFFFYFDFLSHNLLCLFDVHLCFLLCRRFALLMFICVLLLCALSVVTGKEKRMGGGVAWFMVMD